MAHCSPFEDYEYIIFGHDRWFIVAADFLCLLFWIPTFFRLDSSCLKLYLTAATVPMFPLIPVRVAKTLHTVLAPANVEDSWIYCWYLRVEYTLHYWLSYAFLTSTCVYLFLVLKRRSTVFPMERVHMKIFAGMLVEALFRAIVTEFLDQLLWFWPSVVHIWLQILLTMSWFLFMFLHPCRALNHPKEGHGGWSLAWLHLYLVIPFLLNLYQSLFQAAILFPRHSVAGYEAVAADQATYWFSVESYISHKFSFTTMGIIGPMVLLPPVRRAYWKGTVQRRDVIAPAKEAVYGGEGDGPE